MGNLRCFIHVNTKFITMNIIFYIATQLNLFHLRAIKQSKHRAILIAKQNQIREEKADI